VSQLLSEKDIQLSKHVINWLHNIKFKAEKGSISDPAYSGASPDGVLESSKDNLCIIIEIKQLLTFSYVKPALL